MRAYHGLSPASGGAVPVVSSGPISMVGGTDPDIVLDLSRLLSRTLHPLPTGVDRVEMAYARTLLRRIPGRLSFGAVHPITRRYGRLPTDEVIRFLDETGARWEHNGAFESDTDRRLHALNACWRLRPRRIMPGRHPRVLLQSSPHHLDRPATVLNKLKRERARYVCLVHDLIPITHPEYARPGGAELHHRRLRTLAAHADGLLTNSAATAGAVRMAMGDRLGERPVRVAPLAVQDPVTTSGDTPWSGQDYFLCLGTIEPRKNHLLLLHLWRALLAEHGAHAPTLILVGRRGWENENIVDLLDRCAFDGRVREYGRLPDAALRPLIRDARAMLMPSFAEGFGLPIAEALAAGVPVIASDIPAHREAGGDAPDYLDPLDGQAWREAVLAYCEPHGARRGAQLDRIANWRPVTWDSHIDAALSLAEEVVAC